MVEFTNLSGMVFFFAFLSSTDVHLKSKLVTRKKALPGKGEGREFYPLIYPAISTNPSTKGERV